ncbi:MAG: isoprenylcysteine carboxylmethyltransferase family protein [Steroidobacteraceae bacterium]
MFNANSYAAARINLSRLAALILIGALCVTNSRWTGDNALVGSLLALLGWALLAIGVLGRVWSGSYICGRKNEQLMMVGPYSVCRNPLYLFSFIGGFGAMLVTQTLFFPVVFVAIFLSYYQPVMRSEEHTLRRLHGEKFEKFRHNVPLFWPQSFHFVESDQYPICARHFRRFLTEVFWFIVFAAVMQLIHYLHRVGTLPSWYSVY